ncbi:GNAT family N-acetyltransferase [Salinivibrio sp. ES.052]|uniref:GNAT family N-acetyltransferase n=1 Tax=Salinivibrio sp. ES.052 TaxID=1882823 RepID=UPI00092838C4|nr:GNAT family N-acetyltransferase [Salinivibrio sp. ES.052]SIN81784.1 putative acetyltransferase [Salinivibrio sp. ES.052]
MAFADSYSLTLRRMRPADTERVLDIWLNASLQAHHFVDDEFWHQQREAMRSAYLPMADVWVAESHTTIYGFYALHDDTLAAIFVCPEDQGQGVGSLLLDHAKQQKSAINLTVYQKNKASYAFYLRHGFSVDREQTDPHTGEREWRMVYQR